jgi:hypothetical protein
MKQAMAVGGDVLRLRLRRGLDAPRLETWSARVSGAAEGLEHALLGLRRDGVALEARPVLEWARQGALLQLFGAATAR